MKIKNIHQLLFSILLLIGGGVILFLAWQCNIPPHLKEVKAMEEKQRGAHVFGRGDSINFQSLHRNNIEWITLVAFSGQEDFDSPSIRHNRGDSTRIRQRNARWLKRVESAKAAGLKVFIKPHVWINNPSKGKWRSDIFPTSDENWELWKKSYREFIMHYAKIAERTNAEMFCIGTEFSRLTIEKPDYWRQLIKEVRSIYSGKITYAANWYKEFEHITFWGDLDYIGIQAYFPLVKNEYPSVQQISEGWNKHFATIEAVHRKYNRPILFTELGYKSTADSAIKPWEWIDYETDINKPVSTETQANCYEAFFNTVWEKDWFAGVHIWQLRNNYVPRPGGKSHLDFTPQGKPAEQVIAKGFEKTVSQ